MTEAQKNTIEIKEKQVKITQQRNDILKKSKRVKQYCEKCT